MGRKTVLTERRSLPGRTGLRNRHRHGGLSSYSRAQKGRRADSYGTWERGTCLKPEIIAGRTISVDPRERKEERNDGQA